MKNFIGSVLAICFLIPSISLADSRYPNGPNAKMTPGSTCQHASRYRYPERIAYCERNVDTSLKREVIRDYDQKLGYKIQTMDRQAFKIDHYIPLCMGGSNSRDNLWPQHRSVYEITDPLEQLLCEKMAAGVLRQADAMDLIRKAKNNLDQVDDITDYARGL